MNETLSEKEQILRGYLSEDVKEFIKRLKESARIYYQ